LQKISTKRWESPVMAGKLNEKNNEKIQFMAGIT
jgi:hypothetical protein